MRNGWKNTKNSSIFQKKTGVWTKRYPPKQITQWSKNWNIKLLWYANIKKASQDEQQNQPTTTTNINYIKNYLSALKTKFNNKVNTPSGEPKIKQKNL